MESQWPRRRSEHLLDLSDYLLGGPTDASLIASLASDFYPMSLLSTSLLESGKTGLPRIKRQGNSPREPCGSRVAFKA